MADYIYLLENRLSEGQQAALTAVRDVARAQGLTVFLVGGAVRDLTSGSPVRDLDVVVQGNASKLKKQIELSGGVIVGDNPAAQALFVRFPGGIRVEVGSTLSATYPKPGKAVLKPAAILDDLRRRDFTANAMALSLNEGSYGLLMDPLNGVADIENRQLRLVSIYGFIEDPVRMIRAVRFAARLGWAMDEKTKSRYDTSKNEGHIGVLGNFARGYETEEIFHEEDPLLVLRRLEEEGWMKHLFPTMTLAKANATELEKLREIQTQLQMRGIHPHAAASNFPLLTAKFSSKEVAELKRSFVRPGFVKEIESLDAAAKEFATQLLSKTAATPSQAWKLLMSAKPEAVLWVAYSSKSGAIQAKFKNFQTEWPQARNKIPYTLMQEMRITPELPGYEELVEKLFFELMDEKLGTVDEMKAFLESYSPPAPPPPVHLRRARAAKKDAKGRKKPVAAVDGEAEPEEVSSETEDKNKEGDKGVLSVAVKAAPAKMKAAPVKAVKATVKPVPAKSVPVPAKAAPVKKAPVKSVPAAAKKPVATPQKHTAPAKKVVAKAPVKAAPKKAIKIAVKPVSAKKPAPAKKAVPVKKQAPSKKSVPVKKATTAKVTSVKKATPSHKTAPAKKAAPKKRR